MIRSIVRWSCLAVALLATSPGVDAAWAQDATDDLPAAGVSVPIEVRVGRTIVDPGTPLEGAWAAFVEQGQGPVEAAPRAVASDPDGRCIVEGPPDGGVLLVWAEGYAPIAIHARSAPSAPLILDPARDLAVRVRQPTGEPSEDAYVEAEARLPIVGAPLDAPSHHAYRVSGRTDADGAAVLSALPAVNLRVRADAEGFVGPELFPVRASDTPVSLDLQRGATVAGRATIIPGGAPATGATIRGGGRSVRVASDGTFELLAVRPGQVDLEIDALDLLQRAPVRIVLGEGDRRAGVQLELVRTSVLSGLVVGFDGEPIRAAQATLLWPTSEAAWSGLRRDLPELVTAADSGRFSIRDLPPAEGVALEVRAPGHAPLLVEGLSLASGRQTDPLRIEMRAGALLTGRVVDAGGAAAAGVRVEARPIGDAVDRIAADVAITGPGGVFLLDGLPAAPIHLRVVPPVGSAWRVVESGPHTPGAREATNVGALVLADGHALNGTVDGCPRDAVARVHAADGAVHDANVLDGAFTVDGLAPGEALVEIRSADIGGGARALVRLPSGWPIALRWRSAAPVTVRLRGTGRQAVTSAVLTFEPRGPETDDPDAVLPPELTVEAGDVDGVYLVGLEPGPWRVTARSGAMVGSAALDVAAGSGAVVAMDLGRGETVRGFVGAADGGRPVEGAEVVIEHFGTSIVPAIQTVTDGRGHFSVDGVAPGIVRVTVLALDHAIWRSPPTAVRSAETTDLGQIDLIAGGALVGVIHDAYGSPARGAIVVVGHEDGSSTETVSDLHGRFRVEHLAPGGMTVGVGGLITRTRLRLGAAETFVRVLLGEGVALRGRITTDGRAEPFARIDAWTFGDAPSEVTSHTDGDGRFELPPLPPGEVLLEVLAAGAHAPYALRLDLPVAAEHFVDLELPAGGVAGEVRDAMGEGVAGAQLWLWALDEDDRPFEIAARASAGPRGRFLIERVSSGRYEIEARRDGHGEGRSAPFAVRAGTLAFGAVVDLTEEALLEVDILDERGLPVAGGWVVATAYIDAPARVRSRVRASARGKAVLGGLAAGSYEVSVGGPGRGRVELGVLELREGRTDVGRVTLDQGGALRVSAFHPGYVPAPGLLVRLEDMLGRDPRPDDDDVAAGFGRAPTAADGMLLVGDLAPGWYRVGLLMDAPEDAFLVRVRPGEVALVSLWAPWPDTE